MELHEEILTSIIIAIVLASCYVLLPIFLAGVFILDGILVIYTCITVLLQSVCHAIVSRCVHWAMIPTVLLVLMTVYWIKSRSVEVTSAASLCWTALCAKADAIKTLMMDYALLPTCMKKIMDVARDYNMSFARAVVEDADEDLGVGRPGARVRTREQDRLRRCIDGLKSLEAEGLPEPMTTENAMLLILTRIAATDWKGVVYYRILESPGSSGPAQLVERREYETLQPHAHYQKLYLSNTNLFRTDEPDCAICYCPLEVGQAMVTHETCRRTFHTLCLNDSLGRGKLCPFDREKLIVRPDMSSTTPFLGLPINVGAEQEQAENRVRHEPLVREFEHQLPQDQGQNGPRIEIVRAETPRLLRMIDAAIMNQVQQAMREAGPEVPEVVNAGNQIPGNQEPRYQGPRNQAPRLDRRPLHIRPYQNNARGRGRARRAWR